MGKLVLIDESYKALDRITGRYAIGQVVVDDDAATEFKDWLEQNVESDNLRFNLTHKLHFTELSPAQKDKLIEKVSKLMITFKVYVTYVNVPETAGKNIKLALVMESVRHQERNKPGSKYIVEGASEYARIDQLLPGIDIASIDFTSNKALLLPDLLLGVFCGFLDVADPRKSTDIIRWHTLVSNQIRLEVINYYPKQKFYLKREKKIV